MLFTDLFVFITWTLAQPLNYEWTIHDLDFKTDVTILVSARNSGDKRSSKNYSLSFTTPACAQMLDDADPRGICGETIVFLIFPSSMGCSG